MRFIPHRGEEEILLGYRIIRREVTGSGEGGGIKWRVIILTWTKPFAWQGNFDRLGIGKRDDRGVILYRDEAGG